MTFYSRHIINNDIVAYSHMDNDNIYNLVFHDNTQALPKRFLYELKSKIDGNLSITLFYGSGGFVVPQTLPPYIGIIDRQETLKYTCSNYIGQDLLNMYNEMRKFLRGQTCVIDGVTIIPNDCEETKPVCNHQWVNYGFTSLSFCCKLCGMEKSK